MTYEQTIERLKKDAPSSATHLNCLGGYFKRVRCLWYLYSPFTESWECTGKSELNGLNKL